MQGALRIGRLRADCHVTGPPEAAQAVGNRAGRALRDHFPRALRSALGGWLDRDDESVWIVRRLDLSIMTAADSPPDDIAAVMLSSLGRALAGALEGDGDGVNSIRFPRRAEYLAQFVVDAAAGEAWNRWYYAPLAGLRLLPPSAAIRAALTKDAKHGWTALGSLDDRRLALVAQHLTPLDESAILEAFASLAPGVVRDSVRAAALRGCAGASAGGLTGGRSLFAFVRTEVPPSRAVLDAVTAIANSPAGHAPAVTAESALFTRFGGISLLLRDLDALPWSDWTMAWPSPRAGRASAVVKWLVVALCAGRAQSADVLDDLAWRALLGVPVDLTMGDVAGWLREVGRARSRTMAREMLPSVLARGELTWLGFPRRVGIGASWCHVLARIAHAVLRGFAHRLPGFADSTADYVWRNFLAFDATIEVEDARVVVECGRPPLQLVLAITGMTRGLVSGRDPQGRPIVVFGRG